MSAAAPATGLDVDIAVVGGGPVGCAAALLLERAGARVALVDAREWAQPPRDPRLLALSWGSRLLLEQAGAWRLLGGTTPIETVHVSEAGRFGHTLLTPADAGVPTLGYVVEFGDVLAALRERLRQSAVAVSDGCTVDAIAHAPDAITVDGPRPIRARLAVLADGGAHLESLGFEIAERHYRQAALVARVATDTPSRGRAYERFTPDGPVALLPCGNRWGLVWTAPPEQAEALRDLPDPAFLAALQRRFGERAGRFTAVQERSAYPLSLRWARDPVGERCVLIGNAAHALHPVAGQGLNLGLRDAAGLAELAVRTSPAEWGSASWLARYRAARRVDVGAGIAVTDALVRVFSNDFLPLRVLRDFGLGALGCVKPARRFLARRMIFGTRA
ncbi:MAG TPA: FAD-dependent oxidoreductase [Pelomicrobium sp.]|nr:FAD-dependent oxidoreductase [Pelomicrobium sp.]